MTKNNELNSILVPVSCTSDKSSMLDTYESLKDDDKVDNSSSANIDINKRGKPTDSEIYQTLFKAIHEHYLLPETHLPEDELAKAFNVSRTRIRKVLEQLIHEQLVVKLPNKGCFVASMSEDQIKEVFSVRKYLETGVIDLLSLPLKQINLDQLNQLCYEENLALEKGNYSHANTLSGEFHIQLASLTNNETLKAMIKQLIARTSLAIAIYSNPTTMKCDNGCHNKLLSLLRQSDKKVLQEFMIKHLEELEKNLLIQTKSKQNVDFEELFKNLHTNTSFYKRT